MESIFTVPWQRYIVYQGTHQPALPKPLLFFETPPIRNSGHWAASLPASISALYSDLARLSATNSTMEVSGQVPPDISPGISPRNFSQTFLHFSQTFTADISPDIPTFPQNTSPKHFFQKSHFPLRTGLSDELRNKILLVSCMFYTLAFIYEITSSFQDTHIHCISFISYFL